MFQLFVRRLQLSPYNLNQDVIQEIMKYIPFKQALEIGADDHNLSYIAKVTPLEEFQWIGRIEHASSIPMEFPTLLQAQKPWFITDVALLEFMFRTRFDDVVRDLKYRIHFNIDGRHHERPAISSLVLYGRLDLIKCIFRNSPLILKRIQIWFAALGPNVDCFKFIHENNSRSILQPNLLRHVALAGNIDTVKYLMALKTTSFHTFSIINQVAILGNLPMLKLLCEGLSDEKAITEDALCHAVENGDLDMVKYLVENQPSKCWIPDAIYGAALFDHVEILQYLVPRSPECPKSLQLIGSFLDIESNWKNIFSTHCELCAAFYGRKEQEMIEEGGQDIQLGN